MVEKYTIGYVYPESDRSLDDKILIKLLKRKFNLLLFPIEEQIEERIIEERAKFCRLILNNAVYEPFTWEAIELSKTFEEFGLRVINSSHSFYYQEDKWMFYLECLEHKIPTPLTHLISKKLNYNTENIKKLLLEGPIVIKAVFSDKGLCVERIKTFKEFKNKIKKIINKNPISPVIAQKYIEHGAVGHKVFLIGHKPIRGVIIKGKSWEQTGGKEGEHYKIFKPDKRLKELCKKAPRAFGMKWCSLDFVKQDNKWYMIEVNGCPSISLVSKNMKDTERISKMLVNYLHQEVEKLSK
jgi:glutathione synthase/RimK-type ligase-like ATP-grasp enzyme